MDWIRGEILGRGSFGMVNLAVPRSQSSSVSPLMAVKSCAFSQSSSLMNEKLILDELKDCPEVIRCFGESFSYENGEKLYNVLLEFASGGALADRVKGRCDRGLPEFEVRRYTKALLKGLHYIHKLGYVHCDIKLQNILLGPNGGVKIADFGLAKRADWRKDGVSGCELRGTPLYMSPEVVSGGEQGPPADIWAIGCVVAEMVTGAPAWRCSNLAGLLLTIGVGDEVPAVPENLSEEGKDFLGKCFVKNPNQRWTAEMLLDHPFVCDDQELGDLRDEKSVSTSPRCPLDYPDWELSTISSITSLPSPAYSSESGIWFSGESDSRRRSQPDSAAGRLQELVLNQVPDWSVSNEWVTIR
ncbi:mitogen-activated protein kinase kinase kinase 20-like [Henckelia pumila]|uniref:mitogen-activated protein kinase kinase kinase 20-like n=1 Tax=Henckelia pumila TaxID=405737 RepID=UPI003C6E3C9B